MASDNLKPDQAQCVARSPQQLMLKAGDKIAYCTCGRSKLGLLCDGAHRGTMFAPKLIISEKDETVFLCQCRHSNNLPFCDGSHGQLTASCGC